MKLFFQTFSTIGRNFGMVWPPIVTTFAFLILTLVPFALLIGMIVGFENLFTGDLPALDSLPGMAVGFGILAFIILLFILIILYFLLSAFVTAGTYSLASGVLDGNKQYWRNFTRGGFRYLGWSILYAIIMTVIGLLAQILINSLLSGEPFPAQESVSTAAAIVNALFSFAMYYVFALFFPALIDGKERFMDAMSTSFRLAWRTFLVTILPLILLIFLVALYVLALVGIGFLTHPAVSVLLGIPAIVFFAPFLQVWMTLVYRKLTNRPIAPEPENPIQQL